MSALLQKTEFVPGDNLVTYNFWTGWEPPIKEPWFVWLTPGQTTRLKPGDIVWKDEELHPQGGKVYGCKALEIVEVTGLIHPPGNQATVRLKAPCYPYGISEVVSQAARGVCGERKLARLRHPKLMLAYVNRFPWALKSCGGTLAVMESHEKIGGDMPTPGVTGDMREVTTVL